MSNIQKFGLFCLLGCTLSCAPRPAVEVANPNYGGDVQTSKDEGVLSSYQNMGEIGGFKIPKSTFPLSHTAKINTKNPLIIGESQEINIEFTNLSNKSISLDRECWQPFEIIENSMQRIILPVKDSFFCVAISFPPTVLLPGASHLFRIGFWDGVGADGSLVLPGKYTIRGAMKLKLYGKIEIVNAESLVIDVKNK